MNLVDKFTYGIGLDAAQALAMLAMSYQVRPLAKGEQYSEFDGDLYIIPDICMSKSDGREEYRATIPGYLLNSVVLDDSKFDYYLEVSLSVAQNHLIKLQDTINKRYNNVGVKYFDFLVSKASCVAPNYRRQFAKGLYYGYLGDYHTACCLLVPLIERFIRGLCAANKIAIEDRNGKPLGLGKLLNKADVQSLMSKDVYFELRAILSGKKGLNIRNLLAHGSVTDAEAGGIEFFYVWWFALRMVVNLCMVNKDDGSLSDREKNKAGRK